MAISEKQLNANKKNAQKGGIKTKEGKEIVKTISVPGTVNFVVRDKK